MLILDFSCRLHLIIGWKYPCLRVESSDSMKPEKVMPAQSFQNVMLKKLL
jgi:hypothetical protein